MNGLQDVVRWARCRMTGKDCALPVDETLEHLSTEKERLQRRVDALEEQVQLHRRLRGIEHESGPNRNHQCY